MKLKPHILICPSKTHTLILAEKSFRVAHLSPQIKKFFKELSEGKDIESSKECLSHKEWQVLSNFFWKKNLVTSSENAFKNTFLEKQFEYFIAKSDEPLKSHDSLLKAKVCVIGCGGIGNSIVQHLVASGVKNYTLVDFDRVNETNLNRQFCFERPDIGYKKTRVLKSYIEKRLLDCNVSCYDMQVSHPDDLKKINANDSDILICAADKPPIQIQKTVCQFSLDFNTPVVFCGVGLIEAYIGPILIDNEKKKKYLNFLESQLSQNENAKTISTSISFTNSITGSLLAKEIIHLLAGLKGVQCIDNVYTFNCESLETRFSTDIF